MSKIRCDGESEKFYKISRELTGPVEAVNEVDAAVGEVKWSACRPHFRLPRVADWL
jgi:hypothetical protein